MVDAAPRLNGKVALITGGARGQGAAEARRFAAHGATVIITDVLDVEGEATAAALGEPVEFRVHDVTSESDWAHVVDEVMALHGRLDILVNNAGIFVVKGMAETTLDEWERIVAVNQTGVFLGMKAAAPQMISAGSGSIINISSIAGLGASATAHAYGATKWAVRGMSKAAAIELPPYGVRVNSVHPGIIDTAMIDALGPQRDTIHERIPLGRLASTDDVAGLVLFLASDDAAYCTGHEFVIDGGLLA